MGQAWEAVRWAELFSFSVPVLETIIRGSCTYLALFIMLRVVLKRESGSVSVSDILVIVMIADAAQNAMAGSYSSIPDGLLLVATLLFWCYTLDWLAYHFKPIRHWIHPPPLPLIRDGEMLRHNMRKELISKEELMSQLREQGIAAVEEVHQACIEENGNISVITMDDAKKRAKKSKKVF